MWNQGNGNGYGQGYGQQEDVYGRLNNTKDVGGARFPFLEGSGRYALCVLEEFMHNTDGPSARALFEVIESKDGKHQAGTFVTKIWKLVKPAKFPNQPTDADLFADFCRKLKGAPAGHPIGNDIRVLMKERAAEQLARGTVIEAVAVPNQKKTWTNIYWNAVQQTPEQIVAMRQRLEQRGIPGTTQQSAPPQSQPGTYYPQHGGQTPAPGQYGTPTNASQGVPPGGYLASVPVNPGNGNQGGNGGQGSW